jgi:hypothetical protein
MHRSLVSPVTWGMEYFHVDASKVKILPRSYKLQNRMSSDFRTRLDREYTISHGRSNYVRCPNFTCQHWLLGTRVHARLCLAVYAASRDEECCGAKTKMP